MTSVGVDTTQSLRDARVYEMAGSSVQPSPLFIRNRLERLLTFFEAAMDTVTVAFTVFCGYAVYNFLELGGTIQYPVKTVWFMAFGIAALYVILLDRDGAYRPGNSLLLIKETERSLRVSTQTFLLLLPISLFTKSVFPRWAFFFALVCVPVFLVIEKQLLFKAVRVLHSRGFGVRRVLIYGAGSSGRRIFSALVRSPKLGLKPVAVIDDDRALDGQRIFEFSYRHECSIEILSETITSELLQEFGCEVLIVAIPSLGYERFSRALHASRAANVQLAFIPGQHIDRESWTENADVDGILLTIVGRPARIWFYEAAKRPFDLFSALFMTFLLSPILLLIGLLVKLDSPGPVLFRQQRVGRKGRPFDLYKFRTMHVNAPKYAFSPTDSNDPRITRIGRFLRRSSLDELPQLINVMRGEMSLVGPRPEMPFIVERYCAQHSQRLEVTPGITGLWQLSADRAYQIHENIQYDLYYIRNRSFFMDLAILVHTAIFAMRGV